MSLDPTKGSKPFINPADSSQVHTRQRSASFSGKGAERILLRRRTSREGADFIEELATKTSSVAEQKVPSDEKLSAKTAPVVATSKAPDISQKPDPKSPSIVDDKRKRFAEQKPERMERSRYIPKSTVANWNPRARAAVAKLYKEQQERLEEESQSLSSLLPEILSPTSLQMGVKNTEAVQKTLRNEQFLKMIEEVQNHSLKRKFYFYNEGVIPTDELFQIIQARVFLRTSQANPKSEKCVISLLNFCIDWIKKQPMLAPKAETSMRAIVKATKAYTGSDVANVATVKYIREQAANLENNLDAALKPKEVAAPVLFAPSASSYNIDAILASIAKGEIINTDPFVKETADDLLQMFVRLFCQLKDSDLVKHEKSSAYAALTQCTNALAEYVYDAIIFRETLSERKNMMKFFLDVGFKALEREDYQTASCIFNVLSNFVFDKLPETSREVHAHQHYLTLHKFFNPLHDFPHLRERITKCEAKEIPYIPYLPVKFNDFINKEAKHPAELQEDGKDPRLNIEKLAILEKFAKEFLLGQIRWHDVLKNPPVFHTNLVAQYLKDAQYSKEDLENLDTMRNFQAKSYREAVAKK